MRHADKPGRRLLSITFSDKAHRVDTRGRGSSAPTPQDTSDAHEEERVALLQRAIKIGAQRMVSEVLFPQPRREQVDFCNRMSIDAL